MLQNKRIRSYQRESKLLEDKIAVCDTDRPDETPQANNIDSAKELILNGRAYTKPLDGTRDYFLIVIITEDAKRTPRYFAPITNKKIRGVLIQTVYNKTNGTPPSHMREAAERCEILNGLDYNSGDELYMLCDLDQFRRQLNDLNAEKNQDWNIIISNPCIEVWFYYHFESCKPTLPKANKEDENSHHMKQLCGTLNGGTGIKYASLLKKIDVNIPIINARNVFELEDGSNFMPALGSTQMFQLMERLRDLIQIEQ